MPPHVYDRAPLRVYWEITRACDLACRHCRAAARPNAHPDELTTEEALELLDRIRSFAEDGAPPPHLVLTGGDPLKRADLFDLIIAARGRGLNVSVSPSATPLLTPATVARFKAWGVEAISLSLDGATAEAHDAIRGFPGAFERTLEAGRMARRVGLPVQVNTLVAAETLAGLPAILDVVRDVGAARWSLFFLVTVGRGRALESLTAAQADQVMAWVARLPRSARPVVTTTEAPHFRRIRRHASGVRDGNGILFITHTGDITPAGFMPAVTGNVRRDDLVRIYREEALFTALRAPDGFGGRCGRCDLRWECGGSRSRALAVSGDPLAEDPLCSYMPG